MLTKTHKAMHHSLESIVLPIMAILFSLLSAVALITVLIKVVPTYYQNIAAKKTDSYYEEYCEKYTRLDAVGKTFVSGISSEGMSLIADGYSFLYEKTDDSQILLSVYTDDKEAVIDYYLSSEYKLIKTESHQLSQKAFFKNAQCNLSNVIIMATMCAVCLILPTLIVIRMTDELNTLIKSRKEYEESH